MISRTFLQTSFLFFTNISTRYNYKISPNSKSQGSSYYYTEWGMYYASPPPLNKIEFVNLFKNVYRWMQQWPPSCAFKMKVGPTEYKHTLKQNRHKINLIFIRFWTTVQPCVKGNDLITQILLNYRNAIQFFKSSVS